MKQLSILILTIAFCTDIQAQRQIKIITYNILEGLGNDASYGKGRHERCVQWLRDQKADVIALQELYNSEKTLEQDAASWGHRYYAKAQSLGFTSGEPITFTKVYRREGLRPVLHCRTYGIDFFVVHLTPAGREIRLREAEMVTAIIDSVRQMTEKYIVLGDFNSHSPFDRELYLQNPGLTANYARGDKKREAQSDPRQNLLNGQLDYSVMSRFLSFPLIDVALDFVPLYDRHSYPTPILIGVWRTAGNIGRTPERIDYILSSVSLAPRCMQVKIHNGEENDYISDHYPVEAVFEIGPVPDRK